MLSDYFHSALNTLDGWASKFNTILGYFYIFLRSFLGLPVCTTAAAPPPPPPVVQSVFSPLKSSTAFGIPLFTPQWFAHLLKPTILALFIVINVMDLCRFVPTSRLIRQYYPHKQGVFFVHSFIWPIITLPVVITAPIFSQNAPVTTPGHANKTWFLIVLASITLFFFVIRLLALGSVIFIEQSNQKDLVIRSPPIFPRTNIYFGVLYMGFAAVVSQKTEGYLNEKLSFLPNCFSLINWASIGIIYNIVYVRKLFIKRRQFEDHEDWITYIYSTFPYEGFDALVLTLTALNSGLFSQGNIIRIAVYNASLILLNLVFAYLMYFSYCEKKH